MLERKANRYQKRFYLEWVLDRGSRIYNTPLIYEIDGPLDESALLSALSYFVNEYDTGCRSRFREADGIIIQQVAERMPVALRRREAGEPSALAGLLADELDHTFDLETGPLFRFSLLQCGARAAVLLNFHHIITDATSAMRFVQVLRECYLHFAEGSALPQPPIEQAEADDAGLADRNREDVAYWCEQLAGRPLHVDLPRQVQPAQATQDGASHFFDLDAELTQALRQFCRTHGCTPFITIAAVCGVVLSRYAGKSGLVLNYPVDARPAGAKEAIGCFINNYPLPIDIGQGDSLLDLVSDIKRRRKEARQHGEFSLTEVVQQLRQGALTEENLFNVSVVEAYFDDMPLALGACRLLPLPLERRQVVGDLLFAYQPGADNTRFRIDYRLDTFAPGFIARLAESLRWAMATLLAAPDRAIAADVVLHPTLRERLHDMAQGAPVAPAGQEGVMAMFARAAERFPDAPALQYRHETLSYRQVQSAAAILAGRLRAALGVQAGGLVGVHLARKDQAAIAILGVLGSGCAYVPIDPKMPAERVRDLVAESGMRALITDQALAGTTAALANGPVLIDIDAPAHGDGSTAALTLPDASQPAYVIYTSGSTGRPKGVRISHGNLGNAIADFIDAFGIDASSRVVGATAVGFDIFGLELFCALGTGASLLLLDEETADAGQLQAALDTYQPTLLQGTPSLWSLLSMVNWQPRQASGLVALCGGEALSQSLAAYLLRIAGTVYQVYGPTETTIWSSRQLLRHDAQYAVIGRPMGATRLYVLDEAQAPLPWGASGELYIGGAGVGSGYHQRDDLSAERFLALAPLGGERERLYRTGDRVYWNEQGELVYLGRLDFQVKIRGHRIELGEIEHGLYQLPGISQVVVKTCGTPGQIELAAYIVLEPGFQADPEAWRAGLREHLPSYMVPRYFQVMEVLPQTLNGKIDRQALPAPEQQAGADCVPPEGPIEAQLLAIWQRVLKTDRIGATDHFFALGGHSLLAAQMLIAISQTLNVQLSLGHLLRHPTIRELAACIADAAPATSAAALPPRALRFPLSLEQRHLYFIDRYEGGTGHSFNLSVVQKLSGPLDVAALNRALAALVARHDLLHVHIADYDGQLLQCYAPQPLPPLLPEQVAPASLDAVLRELVTQPFDLACPPLYRVRLLAVAEQDYRLVLVLPHIVADGWSFDVLRRELAELYRAERQGRPAALAEPTQRYSDAVTRQAQWFGSDAFGQSLSFWREHLTGYAGMNLPVDFPPSRERGFQGAHHAFALPAGLTAQLKDFATRHGVSLFSCLYGLFALQLRRYCDQTDLVVCVPSANRAAGNEQIVGLFTSMLPLRVAIDDEAPFSSLVQAVGKHAREALAHEGVPLESIRAAGDGRGGPAHALLQAVFAWQNANEQHALDLDGVQCEFIEVEDGIAKYDLLLSMREEDGCLLGRIEYATDRFVPARIERMGRHFIGLAQQAVQLDTPVGAFDIATPAEAATLAVPAPAAQLGAHDTLVHGFATAARAFPDAIALQCGDATLRYAELDTASTALAHRLRARYRQAHGLELAPDTLIGLCVERDMLMVVGMLAILKAGGAYVPLDPSYPASRLRYMAEDSGMGLLLATERSLADSGLADAVPADLCVLLDHEETLAHDGQSLPDIIPSQLAYVIYTSGSTGRPKGALLTHGNVARLFHTSAPLFAFSERDTWCLFHSYAFDFSVWEIWGALLYGARLVVVPYDVSRDPEQFRALLARQHVTVLNQTPSAFVRLIGEDARLADPLPLRYVIFGGEALQVATLAPWFGKYGEAVQLINMYGITETTVHVSFKPVRQDDLLLPYRNDIGKPLPDLTALVLDRNRRLCPVGVAGELYIAGPGLARGYLNQPALTERAFLRDPRLLGGAPLYKTGDLARWLDNGHLEYLGRNDHQVKVRGFRIELGEIQAALMRLPQVSNALAVHDRQRDGIALYYAAPQALDAGDAYAHLRQHLPDFMLPQRLVHAPSLPLTGNGKIDVAALDALATATVPVAEHVAPSNERERLLAEVWQRVLHTGTLGVHADFFASGGDSLRVLDVIRQVREAGYSFTPRDLFRHPTIAQLATVLQQADWTPARRATTPFGLLTPEQLERCREAEDEDIYPLTALQEGMVFHAELGEGSSAYLDVMSCRVSGPFHRAEFAAVLERLMAAHPVLRTIFIRNDTGLWQKVRATSALPLTVYYLQAYEPAQVEAELEDFFSAERSRHFGTDGEPLWRMAVHELAGGFHLTLVCHHAILDGWSVATLLTELLRHYDGLLAGDPVAIAPRALCFRDYVAEEMRWRSDEAAKRHWQDTLQAHEPTLLVPEAGASTDGGTLQRHGVPLDRELGEAIHALAKGQGVAVDHVLLAAHLLALSRQTGRRSVTTGMAAHGRLADDEGHGMLGLFLNSLPCCISLAPDTPPAELLRRLAEYKASSHAYRNYPLRDIQRDARRGALFDTLFNFVNFRVFGQLRDLHHLSVRQGYCYEETNFALVNQTGIDPETGELRVELVYHDHRLGHAQARRFGALFLDALRSLTGTAAGAAERAALAMEFPQAAWLGGRGADLGTASLPERVAAIVAQHGDKTAIRAYGDSVSYRQLEDWANALAHGMQRRHGASLAGARIGLFSTREAPTIVAMLAILKLGAAYVPLDPAYPRTHLENLMRDADLALVAGNAAELARNDWIATVPTFALPPRPLAGDAACEAVMPASRDGLAYVMYTSGSTGQPKGVMVEQAGIVRLVIDTNYVDIQPGQVLAQAASLSFDAATFEVWGALLNGATVALVPPDSLLESRLLEAFLLDEQVDVLFMTTRLFDRHIGSGHAAMFRRLRYLFVGGEVMNPATVAEVLHCPQGRPQHLYNCYGPTENTTFTTMHEIGEACLQADLVPIGWPISHSQVYVLDELQRQAPIGLTGELYTAGTGLARGYLHTDARSEGAFVELALPDADDATPRLRRLYRTGDAVQWLPSGELGFVGRIDRTVKVNGFRINLGELEAAARLCDGVVQCIAVATPGERRQLALYFIGDGLDADALRVALRERLPGFMVPAHLIRLEAFVLNRNGKIDTAQLPQPGSQAASQADAAAFSSPTQQRLYAIWEALLRNGAIGPQDNFFECGGDSLQAMQLQHRINQAFAVDLPVIDVFRYPTIHAMAQHLDTLPSQQASPAKTVADEGHAQRAAALKAQRARLQTRSNAEGLPQ